MFFLPGIYDSTKEEPFELFLSSTNIRYTFYRETHKVLGQTFGMCVLQDFHALTPNLLARTVETVEGWFCVRVGVGTGCALLPC
jgi:N-acetyltransferase 10